MGRPRLAAGKIKIIFGDEKRDGEKSYIDSRQHL